MRTIALVSIFIAIALTGCNMPVETENDSVYDMVEVNEMPYPSTAEIGGALNVSALGKTTGPMIQFGLLPEHTRRTSSGYDRLFWAYITHSSGSDEWGYVVESLEIAGGFILSKGVRVETNTWTIDDDISGGIEIDVPNDETVVIHVTHHDREFGDVSFRRRFESGAHTFVLPPLEYAMLIDNYETGMEEIQTVSIHSGSLQSIDIKSSLESNVVAVYQIGNVPGGGNLRVHVTVKDDGKDTRYHTFVLASGKDEISIPSTYKLSRESEVWLSISREDVLGNGGHNSLHILRHTDFVYRGDNEHGIPMFRAEFNQKG